MQPPIPDTLQAAAPKMRRSEIIIMVAGILFVLIMLTHWGGSASPGPLLALGVAILLTVIVLYGALVWWLFFSPLPLTARIVDRPTSGQVRQLLSSLVIISGLLFVTGGFWDESWHRLFGVPLGEDFWWRPHILIYTSLGLINLFALGGLYLVLRAGKGDLRRRFRAQPLLGLLALASGFQVLMTPIDPLWHEVYGLDITAWSLPHILIGVGFIVVMITSVSIQLSLVPPGGWRRLAGLCIQELSAALLLALGMTIAVQFGLTEWDNMIGPVSDVGRASAAFMARPEWLYPVVLTTIAALMGSIALHATRRAGMATIMGLLTLGLRAALQTIFQTEALGMTWTAHLFLIAPLVALDVWYGLRLRAASRPLVIGLGGAAAGLAVLVVDVPLIAQWMVYPRVNTETLPMMIIMSLVVGAASGWVGARVGGFLAFFDRRSIPETAGGQRSAWLGAAALAAAAVFLAYMIATATPPAL